MAAAKKEKLTEKKKAKKRAMKERKMVRAVMLHEDVRILAMFYILLKLASCVSYCWQEQQEEKLVNQAISLQQDKMQSLTDRERRAMAAERRMTAQLPDSIEVTRYGSSRHVSLGLKAVTFAGSVGFHIRICLNARQTMQ